MTEQADDVKSTTFDEFEEAARWLSVTMRADEGERADGLFRDSLVRRLATQRGEELARKLRLGNRNAGIVVTSVHLFDCIIEEQIAQGVDMVISLAAGIDTRPFRMQLPPGLQWIEVDLPDAITHKQQALAGEAPRCALNQVSLNPASVRGRRELLELAGSARNTLVVDHGYLDKMTAEEVGLLAEDLARPPGVRRLLITMIAPQIRRAVRRKYKTGGERERSAPAFGAPDGAEFFTRYGWYPEQVHSVMKTAAALGRLPITLRLMRRLIELQGPPYNVVLLAKRSM